VQEIMVVAFYPFPHPHQNMRRWFFDEREESAERLAILKGLNMTGEEIIRGLHRVMNIG